MTPFSTRKYIKTFEHRMKHNEILNEKINGSAGEISIQESSVNQKSNNTMSVMFCTGATFVKKNPT